MALIIVRQEVENFKKWKDVFDAAYPLRKAGGEKSCKIFRGVENPNELTLLLEWDSIESAAKYSQNKLFHEASKKAGTITKPVVYLPEEGLESKTGLP